MVVGIKTLHRIKRSLCIIIGEKLTMAASRKKKRFYRRRSGYPREKKLPDVSDSLIA